MFNIYYKKFFGKEGAFSHNSINMDFYDLTFFDFLIHSSISNVDHTESKLFTQTISCTEKNYAIPKLLFSSKNTFKYCTITGLTKN